MLPKKSELFLGLTRPQVHCVCHDVAHMSYDNEQDKTEPVY